MAKEKSFLETEVKFSNNFTQDTYKLLEIPMELADEIEKKKSESNQESMNLVFRGLPNDEAVLCTKDKTYQIKKVQTSNSMLIVTPQLSSNDINKNFEYSINDNLSSYYELIEISPKVNKILNILSQSKYQGPDEEDRFSNSNIKFYTFTDILNEIQASENEILEALKDSNAININGYWRILDSNYIQVFIETLLNNMVIYELPSEHLPLSKVIEVSAEFDFPDNITEHVLESFSESLLKEDQEIYYNLSKEKIARFLGIQLLASNMPNSIEYTIFMEKWKNIVPEDYEINLKLLEGFYIEEETSFQLNKKQIRYFPKTELSHDLKHRLNELFFAKPKWKAEDLIPYIIDLESNRKKLDRALIKYARTSKIGKQVFYTSRQ